MERKDWTEMTKDASRIETLIPEFEARLIPLIRDIRFIEEHGETSARHLRSDLDNLMGAAREAAALKNAGVEAEGVNEAIRALSDLLKDMISRSSKLINDKIEEVRVNAVVAAHRVENHGGPPTDVTREFKTLYAHPAIGDENGVQRVCKTGYNSDVEMGTVSGEVLIAVPKDQLNAAPLGAVILPKGKSLTLHQGDVITLHTHGYNLKNDLVMGRVHKSLMIEATDKEAIFTGPLLISPSPFPKKTLSMLNGQQETVDKIERLFKKNADAAFLYPFCAILCLMLLLASLNASANWPWMCSALLFTGLVCFGIKRVKNVTKKMHSLIREMSFWKETMTQLKVAKTNNLFESKIQQLGLVRDNFFEWTTKNSALVVELETANKSLSLLESKEIYALPARFTMVNDENPLRILEEAVAIEDKRDFETDNNLEQNVSVLH